MCFNYMRGGHILQKYKKLTRYEDYITDVLVSKEFNYEITSTFFGHIFVWRFGKKGKFQTIHQFSGHTKTVTSLCSHPVPTLIISASLDSTIKIWCLDVRLRLL